MISQKINVKKIGVKGVIVWRIVKEDLIELAGCVLQTSKILQGRKKKRGPPLGGFSHMRSHNYVTHFGKTRHNAAIQLVNNSHSS